GYPGGHALIAAIEPVQALKKDHGFKPAAVERAEAGPSRYTCDKLCYPLPQTGLEAKFSMPYTIARGIMDDAIGFDTFTDRMVQEPAAQELTKRISMYEHEGIEKAWKGGSRPVNVRIHLRAGRMPARQV